MKCFKNTPFSYVCHIIPFSDVFSPSSPRFTKYSHLHGSPSCKVGCCSCYMMIFQCSPQANCAKLALNSKLILVSDQWMSKKKCPGLDYLREYWMFVCMIACETNSWLVQIFWKPKQFTGFSMGFHISPNGCSKKGWRNPCGKNPQPSQWFFHHPRSCIPPLAPAKATGNSQISQESPWRKLRWKPTGGPREGSRPQLRQWIDDFAAIVGKNLTWNLLKAWLNKEVSHVTMKNKSKFASNHI